MARRFTLAEAQRLIPRLDRLLRDAILLKAKYEEAERTMRSFSERIMLMGGVVIDRDEAAKAKQRREDAAAHLRTAIEEIQEVGCLIKDLDIGLVDFPTLFHGTEVYLCWRLGESQIEFWHGVDEGFRGRKPIDQDFMENHEGDRPS